jgi:2-hydroxychromene-2-carboxylate isomerase
MSKTVEFFYDYVSLYSYLANSRVQNLSGANLLYRPMFLGGVMQATGNRPPGIVEAKGRYMQQDVQRWVERYSLPFKMNPEVPQNTLKALRLALIAQKRGSFDTVHQPLFDAMWVHEQNLDDNEVIAEIAAKAGISMDDIEQTSVKDELRANTEEAVARGAFGAPSFFVDDQMFFGNDRFEFIQEQIGV